jgi:hypothetical protein
MKPWGRYPEGLEEPSGMVGQNAVGVNENAATGVQKRPGEGHVPGAGETRPSPGRVDGWKQPALGCTCNNTAPLLGLDKRSMKIRLNAP